MDRGAWSTAVHGVKNVGHVAQRSYSMFKVRRGDLLQGKKQQLHFAGAAVKRYPTSKVRENKERQ